MHCDIARSATNTSVPEREILQKSGITTIVKFHNGYSISSTLKSEHVSEFSKTDISVRQKSDRHYYMRSECTEWHVSESHSARRCLQHGRHKQGIYIAIIPQRIYTILTWMSAYITDLRGSIKYTHYCQCLTQTRQYTTKLVSLCAL